MGPELEHATPGGDVARFPPLFEDVSNVWTDDAQDAQSHQQGAELPVVRHPMVVRVFVYHDVRQRHVFETRQRLEAPRETRLIWATQQQGQCVLHHEEDDGEKASSRDGAHAVVRAEERVREVTFAGVLRLGGCANRGVLRVCEIVKDRRRLKSVSVGRARPGREEEAAGGGGGGDGVVRD